MTELQKIQLRSSEVRQRLNELSGVAELTDEQRSEIDTLTAEYGDLERRGRAATVAESEPLETREQRGETVTPEDRELADLERRADLGAIVGAWLSGKTTDGAEAELQQHLGLDADQIPLTMLRERRDDTGNLETRTAGVTPAPDTGSVGAVQQPIIPAVFPMGAAAFLGIPQPTVPVGEQVYTVLSNSIAAGTPAQGANQAHGTAGFTAKLLSPSRIQASLFYAIEDRARLRGMSEALRQNLTEAMADKLDEVVLDDLLTGTTLIGKTASDPDDFESYRRRFAYDLVDGIRAGTSGDMRMVVGTATYAHMAASYRGESSDLDALRSLQQDTGGVRVSAHAPDVAASKQYGVVRIGNREDAVTPIWQALTLIEDKYTQAKAGEVVVTAVMLHAHKVLRRPGFAKVQAQHA